MTRGGIRPAVKLFARRLMRSSAPLLTPPTLPLIKRRIGPVRLRRYLCEAAVYRWVSTHPQSFNVPTYWGARIEGNTRDLIQRAIALTGVWEPHLSAIVQACLSEGDVFVDVGGNIGYFTLLGSHCVGESGQVLTFEPSPLIYSMLERNLALNDVRNVVPRNEAAGSASGTMPLYVDAEGNLGSSTLTAAAATHHRYEADVAVVDLDSAVPRELWERIALIKIDVEGAEGSVLAGMTHLVRRLPDRAQLVVEVTPTWGAGPLGEALATLGTMGYVPFIVPDDALTLSFEPISEPLPRADLEALPDQCTLLFRRA